MKNKFPHSIRDKEPAFIDYADNNIVHEWDYQFETDFLSAKQQESLKLKQTQI